MCFSKDNSTLILQQKAERKKSEKWERTMKTITVETKKYKRIQKKK